MLEGFHAEFLRAESPFAFVVPQPIEDFCVLFPIGILPLNRADVEPFGDEVAEAFEHAGFLYGIADLSNSGLHT